MGIRAKLILSTCIPLLILYVIVLVWDYSASSSAALETIEQLVAQRAKADAAQLDGRVAAIQAICDRIAEREARRIAGERGQAAGTRPAEPAGPPVAEPGRGGNDFNRPPGDTGRPPGDFGPPPGEPGRGPDQRGGRGPFGGGGGPFGGGGRGELVEPFRQSPWVNAVWYRFDPAVPRVRDWPEAGGLRRSSVDERLAPYLPPADRDSAWYSRPMRENRGVWLEPDDVHDPALGPACVYAAPFYSMGESTPAGVVCVSVPVATLRLLRQDVPLPTPPRQSPGAPAAGRPADEPGKEPPSLADGGYMLLDRKGRILSRPDGKNLGSTLAVGPDDDELRQGIDRALGGRGAIVVAGGLNSPLGEMAPNSRYVLAMEQVPSTGWVYVTAQAEAYLIGPVQSRLIKRGLFLVGGLFLLVGMTAFVLTRFCRPIEKMAVRVRQLARGDLDIDPVPVLANDELGQLASGFNEMTGRLRHHVRELTEQSAEREKVDSELRIARQIQSDLLPRGCPPFPDRTEFALHAVNLPARHIAGDFFDYFFTEHGRLTVVIADVSGKGVPAALMMAVVRTMVRNLSETGQCPKQIAERVNRMLVNETTPGLFVTMILGHYEPDTGRFTYVNAGHPPAVCVTNGTAGTCCEPTGPLLGVSLDDLGPFEQATITLAPGDGVLLYTDGVTEAHDETNVMFGEARLLKVATALADRAPPDLCEGVVEAVMAYQHQSAADDLTLVSLRRTADNAAR